MQRIRTLSRHVSSGLEASTVSQGAPATSEGRSSGSPLSEAEQAKVGETFVKYQQSVDALMSEGTLPEMTIFDVRLATKHELGAFLDKEDAKRMLREAETDGTLNTLNALPGPWQDAKTFEQQVALMEENLQSLLAGNDMGLYAQWQEKYGDAGFASNIVTPRVLPRGLGTKRQLYLTARVVLANPADAARIARTHVRKEGNLKEALYDSVISTVDNEHWTRQRHALIEPFLPIASLSKILPVSRERAKHCADRLAGLAAAGAVDMSDFLLHEAQAQLQLALLGAPEELMNATNEDVRASFMGDLNAGSIGAIGGAMKKLMDHAANDSSLALPSDDRPVKGPLSRSVQQSANLNLSAADNYGNMLLILFAGHDTTGHTMTWFLFELARHLDIQREVQGEVDAFFASLAGRDPEYRDFGQGHLDLLDRCVTETLRLWNAVPNGTFRQLQFADTIQGPNNTEVELPKGSCINVVTYHRHRNPDLWGPDAQEFNPRRSFREEEIARVGQAGASMNPESDRFSPFAHNPRSCLGKNFAQMEMRLILCYLLKRFTFTLAPPYDSLMGAPNSPTSTTGFRGINRGTSGPMDMERSSDHSWGNRPLVAMKLNVTPRG